MAEFKRQRREYAEFFHNGLKKSYEVVFAPKILLS